MQTLTYRASDADFANPERGFFALFDPVFFNNSNRLLTDADLEGFREDGITLVGKRYVLTDWLDSALPQSFLDAFQDDLDTVARAGMKMIPKFIYAWNLSINDEDASESRTLEHLAQLAPVLRANGAVIDHMQAGFVGEYAEWHDSTNGHVADGTLALRDSGRAIISAMLDAMPADRMVTLRYPDHLIDRVGTPVGPDRAFDGSDAARLGFNNDGFLYDETDFGTFDPDRQAAQAAFTRAQTEFTAVSGEPAGTDGSGYSFLADPVAQLDAFNFRSLSVAQTDAVEAGIYQDWRDRGLYDDIERGLGYRFELREATLPETVLRDGTLDLTFDIANTGFARLVNPRPVDVVLTGETDTWRIRTDLDPRDWDDGAVSRIALSLDMPGGIEAGRYDVALSLPDAAPALATDPRYAIRFANETVWQADTGLNTLGASIEVSDTLGVAGIAEITQAGPDDWTRVAFGTSLSDAVVVLGPPSAFGSQPATVRIRDVDDTGFEMQIDEWAYLDGRHVRELVSWVAVEAGVHRLSDGRVIEAGRQSADDGWTDVALSASAFGAAPSVFATVDASPAGAEDQDALATRLDAVGADGFRLRLDAEEEAGDSPVSSDVNWIAVTRGKGAVDVTRLGPVDHEGIAVDFDAPFDMRPVLLASMQTTRGPDPASLRIETWQPGRAALRVEEERSRDAEIAHAREAVSLLTLAPGLIEGWEGAL